MKQRSKINRIPVRGFYDKETIYKIIDEAYFCHVSFIQDGIPFIIPTIHARLDDTLILHGAKASRMLKHITDGNDVVVAVTILDGIVLARSVFHHSMNYRSAIIFGKGIEINNQNLKLKAFKTITDKIVPGRWDDARIPNQKEMDATSAIEIKIEEASAKIRTGPPNDDDEDYKLNVWAGVIPVRQTFDAPEEDPGLPDGIRLPDYVKSLILKR